MRRLFASFFFLTFSCFTNWGQSPAFSGDQPFEERGADHWSYRPLDHGVIPHTPRLAGKQNAVDAFILHRLEQENLSFSPPADRRMLIRRVMLDLIGLPPSPVEVQQFVKDERPDAYQRLVERLLASPHYGERWARPWVDLCHYADSDGYLTDQLRPVAWRYRQWLVQALNRNLPFDQFTVQQLAGDLLPEANDHQRLATGFLRQTLSNREGGANLEEFRVRQVVDRTSMMGTIWLGLTVGCARCHDHKYDELSQQEFFQLYAFFNNADRIRYAFLLATARRALPHEQQRLIDYLDEQVDDCCSAVQIENSRAGKSCNCRWTNLCTVLLNLHEFITRD